MSTKPSENMARICPHCGTENGVELYRSWWRKMLRRPREFFCSNKKCRMVYVEVKNSPKIVDPNIFE